VGKNADVFVVDDLLGWLVGLAADAGRKKLVTLVLGTDQERALRPAVEAAVAATAAQLAPSKGQADQLATAIGEVFHGAPKVALAGQGTLLEALQAGITAQVAVLGVRQLRAITNVMQPRSRSQHPVLWAQLPRPASACAPTARTWLQRRGNGATRYRSASKRASRTSVIALNVQVRLSSLLR
jgi:hypothetical protein